MVVDEVRVCASPYQERNELPVETSHDIYFRESNSEEMNTKQQVMQY